MSVCSESGKHNVGTNKTDDIKSDNTHIDIYIADIAAQASPQQLTRTTFDA